MDRNLRPHRVCQIADYSQDLVGKIHKISKEKGYDDILALTTEILEYLEKLPGRRAKKEYE